MEEEEGNMSIPCILAEVAWPSEEELDIKEEKHLVLLLFFLITALLWICIEISKCTQLVKYSNLRWPGKFLKRAWTCFCSPQLHALGF